MNFSNFLNLNFFVIFIITLLTIIGVAAQYSAADGNLEPWAIKHGIRYIVLLFLMTFIALMNISFFYKHAYTIFFISLCLLLSVEIIGTFGKGAERWIRIFGVSIQPSEIVKIGIILSLAKYYHTIKFENIGHLFHLFIPLLIIFLPFLFVLIQPDLGTSISILLLGAIIMFVSGVRIWKFILASILIMVSIPFLWNYVIQPYQKNRILSFLNPESDPLGQGYQLIQSKIALGSGSLVGKGFLKGTQAYLEYLPEKQTDFIFTLIGEEFGFLGTIFVLLLLLLEINLYSKRLLFGVFDSLSSKL